MSQYPMCPFCNRENTYVVRLNGNRFHCNNCGGDFNFQGEPIIWPDEDELEQRPFVPSPEQIREILRIAEKKRIEKQQNKPE